MSQQLPQMSAMLRLVSWCWSTYCWTLSWGPSGGPVYLPLFFGEEVDRYLGYEGIVRLRIPVTKNFGEGGYLAGGLGASPWFLG